MALQYVKESEYSANPTSYAGPNYVIYRDNAFDVNPEKGYYAYKDSKGQTRYSLQQQGGGSTTVYANSLEQALKQATAENAGKTYLAGQAFFSNPDEAEKLTETKQFFATNAQGNLTEGLNGMTAQERVDASAEKRALATTELAQSQAKQAARQAQGGANPSISLVPGGQEITQGGQTTFQADPNYNPGLGVTMDNQITNRMVDSSQLPESQRENIPQQSLSSTPIATSMSTGDTLAQVAEALQTMKQGQDAGLEITGQTTANQVKQQMNAAQTNYETLGSKFNLPDINQGQQMFSGDPLSTIQSITSQILNTMGYGDANKLITSITDEVEDLENKRDSQIRQINDDPWLTEGVRLRQIQKAEQKWADQIDNRVNKLRLLESTREDARQQAQFALGTAISLWDSERRFQQDQVQFYYQQAQQSFENQIALQKMAFDQEQASKPNVSAQMEDYLYAVENGLFSGGYFDFISQEVTPGRAPSSGGGSGLTANGITDANGKLIKLTAGQVDVISGFENTFSSANTALSLLSKGTQTGPIAGRALQASKLTGNANPDQLTLEQTLGKLKADFMKSLSGAAVSDAEVVRLSKFLPDIYDQESVIKSKLNTLIAETEAAKSNYLNTLGAVDNNTQSQGQYYGPEAPDDVFDQVVTSQSGGLFSSFIGGLTNLFSR